MRRVPLVLFLLLCLAEGAECAVRTVNVSSLGQLKKICKFPGHLYACTAFETRKLAVECRKCDQGWRMMATAELTPVIYLWDPRTLGHEWLHIGDIARAVAAHEEQLENRRYNSEEDCERAAGAEMTGFAREIDVFAATSNDQRHYEHSQRLRLSR